MCVESISLNVSGTRDSGRVSSLIIFLRDVDHFSHLTDRLRLCFSVNSVPDYFVPVSSQTLSVKVLYLHLINGIHSLLCFHHRSLKILEINTLVMYF